MKQKKLAIIDMGSNSIRLVINLIQRDGCYKELYNFKVVARLSSHINEHDEITKKGIKIIIDTLRKFSDIISFHEVNETTAVATAAIRRAKNQAEVLTKIKNETGIHVRVLSGYEEAYYGYLAVVNSTNVENGITIDIGGGSTEITMFKDRKLLHYHSFSFGAITLKKMFIENDPPTEEEVLKLKQYLQNKYSELPWLNENKENLPVIGIGGTARNLSLIHQRKVNYPISGLHQYSLLENEIEDIQTQLITSPLNKRQDIEGLSKDRADIIIPGVQAIFSLVEHIKAPQFIMSNKGLRDGIFYEEILKQLNYESFPNVAEESFYQLSRSYKINKSHIVQIFKIARSIYKGISPYIKIETSENEDLNLLKYSSNVLYLGEFINSEASSQHTFYLLTNMTIDGLSPEDRLALAFVASFKSKAQLTNYYHSFSELVSKDQLMRYELLGAILKLSFSLNRTRRNIVQEISVTKHAKNQITLHIVCSEEAYFEEQTTIKYKKHLERALSEQIEIHFEQSSN